MDIPHTAYRIPHMDIPHTAYHIRTYRIPHTDIPHTSCRIPACKHQKQKAAVLSSECQKRGRRDGCLVVESTGSNKLTWSMWYTPSAAGHAAAQYPWGLLGWLLTRVGSQRCPAMTKGDMHLICTFKLQSFNKTYHLPPYPQKTKAIMHPGSGTRRLRAESQHI